MRRPEKYSYSTSFRAGSLSETFRLMWVHVRRLRRQAEASRRTAHENEQRANELLAEVAEIDETIKQLRQT